MPINRQYNPAIHHRKSVRLPGWDYSSPGYYFITVCTHNRECLFGYTDNGKMCLNEYGTIVQNEWDKSFVIRRELLRDEFVVMPNHFHGIVRTHGRAFLRYPETGDTPQQNGVAYRSPKSIPSFMAGVKSAITKRINEIRKTPGVQVLQPRFHDHIIRDDDELFRIRQYIKNNPFNWDRDKMNGGINNRVFEESAPYGEEPWMI